MASQRPAKRQRTDGYRFPFMDPYVEPDISNDRAALTAAARKHHRLANPRPDPYYALARRDQSLHARYEQADANQLTALRLNNGTYMPGRAGWNIPFDPKGDLIIAREYDKLGLPAIDPYANKAHSQPRNPEAARTGFHGWGHTDEELSHMQPTMYGEPSRAVPHNKSGVYKGTVDGGPDAAGEEIPPGGFDPGRGDWGILHEAEYDRINELYRNYQLEQEAKYIRQLGELYETERRQQLLDFARDFGHIGTQLGTDALKQAAGTQDGSGAMMSRRADAEPETPRERRPLPAPDTPEGREFSALDRKLHQLVAAVYTGGALAGMDTEQTKEALLFTWDQLTKWLAGRDFDVEDAYYGSMSPQHLDAALGIASSPSQTGQGLEHMRQMLGSGAQREQRLQHIAQAVEMRGSGAPSTRPAPQVLQFSAARVARKPVTGLPHAGASAPTVIAGTGLIAPAPG